MNSLHSPVSTHFNAMLKAALGAVPLLDERGLAIRDIRMAGSRPVIEIDPPPAGSFLRGALRRRVTIGNVTRTVMATAFHDCQLEWEITETRTPEVMRA